MSRHSCHPWALGAERIWTEKDVHHCSCVPPESFHFFCGLCCRFGAFSLSGYIFNRTEDISVAGNLQTSCGRALEGSFPFK